MSTGASPNPEIAAQVLLTAKLFSVLGVCSTEYQAQRGESSSVHARHFVSRRAVALVDPLV